MIHPGAGISKKQVKGEMQSNRSKYGMASRHQQSALGNSCLCSDLKTDAGLLTPKVCRAPEKISKLHGRVPSLFWVNISLGGRVSSNCGIRGHRKAGAVIS